MDLGHHQARAVKYQGMRLRIYTCLSKVSRYVISSHSRIGGKSREEDGLMIGSTSGLYSPSLRGYSIKLPKTPN